MNSFRKHIHECEYKTQIMKMKTFYFRFFFHLRFLLPIFSTDSHSSYASMYVRNALGIEKKTHARTHSCTHGCLNWNGWKCQMFISYTWLFCNSAAVKLSRSQCGCASPNRIKKPLNHLHFHFLFFPIFFFFILVSHSF